MSELTPEAKNLFRAARASYAPSEARLTAVGIAVAAQMGHAAQAFGSTGSTAANAAGKAAAVSVTAGAKGALVLGPLHWIGLSLVVGGLGTATMVWHAHRAPTPARGSDPVHAVAPAAAPAAPAALPPAVPAADQPADRVGQMVDSLPAASDFAANDARGAGSRVVPRRAAPAPAGGPNVTGSPSGAPESTERSAPADDSLAQEIALLRDARAALDAGDAARSLAILNQYAAQFPKATLAQEQLATRVLALCAVGRTDAARRDARKLERIAPHSPHLAQIRASCAGTPGD